ncbi:DUF502 domain-containing protein [Halioxenophilus sp. WMMB6]|uniref:DUF502 domain-containing protein n=1 Tax=Halioxenophilus sp. WMMB6 TaxID=3073815 RepID=UPI00295E53CF|nr:DUF502 domain-containing protein [Halioxenophilus sp. WMMB6]
MQKLFTLILQGLVTLLPLALTLYALYWLAATLETLCRELLILLLPNFWYFPGLGLITALALLVAGGLLMNVYGMRYLVGLANRLVQKIPLAKSIYASISDIITVFSLGKNSDLSSVVSVDMGNGYYQIGFVTGENAGAKLFPGQDRVGVYMPMSFMIGGHTMYIKRDQLIPLDIGIEEAMRLAITGGAQKKQEHKPAAVVKPLEQK